MKHKKKIWVLSMMMLSFSMTGSYTNASSAQEYIAPRTTFATVALAAGLEEASTPEPEPKPEPDPLRVVFQGDASLAKTDISVTHSGKSQSYALDSKGACVLNLVPAEQYLLRGKGMELTFDLRENASIANVTGKGWSDGELLYMTEDFSGTLTVLVGAVGSDPEGWPYYRLEKDEDIWVGSLSGENQRGRFVFSGLEEGIYNLIDGSGNNRSILISQTMPHVTFSTQ